MSDAPVIGPTFRAELEAAGLGYLIVGDQVIWNSTGILAYQRGISAADRAAVEVVLAKHDPTANPLLGYAAAKRYAVEVAGVNATIGGASVVVSTARDMRDGMRDTMLGIIVNLRKDGAVLKIFADGVPRPATNAEAETAITAAYAHVQAAFDVEGKLVEAIAASPPTVTSEAQVDAAAWPPGPTA